MLWPILNDVATGDTPAYPDIQPQRFNQPQQRIVDAAVDVMGSLKGWRVFEHAESKVCAIRTTRLLRFKDDITLRVLPDGEGWFRVHIRSKSRVGKADFGQNARNIRELQAALSQRL